ncbi:MAG: DUF488 domain-containing protein [Halalkalicoccus sp.]|nr:DUF488 domain-containing protein [Halalkalicoccus sp.]
MTRGTVSETYHAALSHGFADVSEDATRIGVVRRPTAWFSREVDENVPELGPPEELLEEFERRHEDFKMQGMCDEGAHNAAWDEVKFGERYREHLDSPEAGAALSALAERVANGESVALVCFEKGTKRCHRHLLEAELTARLDRA